MMPEDNKEIKCKVCVSTFILLPEQCVLIYDAEPHFTVFIEVCILIPLLLKSHILCLSICVLPGGCVHVLWVPAGPLGTAGVQPVLPKEPLTLPPPAPCPGLEVPQLHFHAHRVSSHPSIF